MAVSDEWKTMGDFAPGLDANRLPSTKALAGKTITVNTTDGFRVVNRIGDDTFEYEVTDGPRAGQSGTEAYDAVEVRPGIFFMSFGHPETPEGVVQVLNMNTGRALVVVSYLTGATNHIDPKIDQICMVGDIEEVAQSGDNPSRSKDLVGKRMFYRYSKTQAYEHIYITSRRFAWHALEGPQAGHSDVELTNTFKIDDELYFFSWFEKIIPTCGNFIFDLQSMRSTGFFFGLSGEGEPLTGKAGAFFEFLSTTSYPEGVTTA